MGDGKSLAKSFTASNEITRLPERDAHVFPDDGDHSVVPDRACDIERLTVILESASILVCGAVHVAEIVECGCDFNPQYTELSTQHQSLSIMNESGIRQSRIPVQRTNAIV